MRPAGVIVAALVLAGCAEAPDPTIDAGSTRAAGAFVVLDTTATCPRFCEPNVAVTVDGTWFVLGDSLTRSADGGASWEERDLPTPPVPTAVFQTDSMIVAAPDGRLFYSALIASCPFVCFLTGIQVASSDDEGGSWRSTLLSLPSHPGGPGADRQWLAFGPEGVVCLHFQYVGPVLPPLGITRGEVRISCSTDGGASFPDFVSVSGPAPGYVINGRGVFDAAGTLFIPYFFGADLVVATSKDQGRTFEPHTVESAAGDYFPALSVDASGTLHLLWRDANQRVGYSTSEDGAATWSAPRVVSAPGQTTPTSPWIEAHAAGVAASWFVVEDEHTNAVVHWDGVEATTLATSLPNRQFRTAATDFAHLTLTSDARALVVFGDLGDRTTRLAVVG